MSGLLRLASCSAYSPAEAAFRGGPAARSAPATPSVALLISGGLHLAALALFLIVVARPGLEESPGVEIRAFPLPPGIVLTPPPTGGAAVPRDDNRKRGTLEPVDKNPGLKSSVEDLFRNIERVGAVRPDAPVNGSGKGSSDPSGTVNPPAVAPDVIRDYDEEPVPLFAPEPEYPVIALEAGIEGKVVVEALVGRDGEVRKIVVKEGNPILADSASKAVKTWRFKPGRWRGVAVTTWVAVPVVFRLH